MHFPPGFPKGGKKWTTPKVIVVRAFPGPNSGREGRIGGDPAFPHGTHVSGIAAGRPGTTAPPSSEHPQVNGLSGVAPNAWLGAYRVFTIPTPLGQSANTPEIVEAFEAAVRDGMDVINFSGGGPQTDPANDAMMETVTNVVQAGVVPVISAGNDRDDFGLGSDGSPGTAPEAITVAAVTNKHVFTPTLTLDSPNLPGIPQDDPLPAGDRTEHPQHVGVQRAAADRHRHDRRPRRDARRPAPLRTAQRSERRVQPASRRLADRLDRARLARLLQLRLEGRAREGGRRDRARDGEQPRRHAERHPGRDGRPLGDDLRPRRAAAQNRARRLARPRADPHRHRHPPDPDRARRRRDLLLLGRAHGLRPPAEARRVRPGRRHPLLGHEGARPLPVLRLRRDEHVGAARHGRGRAPGRAAPQLDAAADQVGADDDRRAGLGEHGEDAGSAGDARGRRPDQRGQGGQSAPLPRSGLALVRRPEREPRRGEVAARRRLGRGRRSRHVERRAGAAVGHGRGDHSGAGLDRRRPGRERGRPGDRQGERGCHGGCELRVHRPPQGRRDAARPVPVPRHAARVRRRRREEAPGLADGDDEVRSQSGERLPLPRVGLRTAARLHGAAADERGRRARSSTRRSSRRRSSTWASPSSSAPPTRSSTRSSSARPTRTTSRATPGRPST